MGDCTPDDIMLGLFNFPGAFLGFCSLLFRGAHHRYACY